MELCRIRSCGALRFLRIDLQPPVMIHVGENKGAAIFEKVHADGTGDLGKSSVAVVGEHHIPRIAVPGLSRNGSIR